MSAIANQLLQSVDSIQKLTVNSPSGSRSSVSFTVVYNKNGKRLTFTKKLAEILGLTDTAHIAFVADAGVVLVAKHISDDSDKRMELNLKLSKGIKTAYHAEAAATIVNTFNLDYDNGTTSRTFKNIDIDTTDPNNPIAVIKIKEVA